jgi:NNP family nitrate/nitrite transporter-like MFS transporter
VPFAEQMKPLRNLQVWRFSLYYFFVFGAFVALALWLPRYLTGAYGLDVKTAGLIAACYSIPASLFRIVGGWLSDRIGARRVMYWTFGVSAVCTFLLSYPSTTYVVDGINGPMEFRLAVAWCRSWCWCSCSVSSCRWARPRCTSTSRSTTRTTSARSAAWWA